MSFYPKETINEVLRELDIERLLQLLDYRTETIQKMGDTVKCFCPIHQEQVFRTLIIELPTKSFRCSYSMCPGRDGGDLIKLFALAKKIEYEEALFELVEQFELPIDLPHPIEFIERTIEIAENFLELGVLEEAEAEFAKIRRMRAENVELKLRLAAAEGLAEILRQRQESGKLKIHLRELFDLLTEAGEHEQALKCAREQLTLDPQNIEARELLAESHFALKQPMEAVNELMNVAGACEEQGDFERALRLYRRIQQLDTGLVDVTPHLSQALATLGRAGMAVEELLNQAQVRLGQERWEEAVNCFKLALDLDESRDDVREQLVAAALSAGLSDAQLHDCFDAIDHYLRREAPGLAEEILKKLKEHLPNHTLVLEKEVDILRRQGRDEQAADRQLALIDARLKKGDVREARVRLENLARQAEHSRETIKRIAHAAGSAGDLQLARDMLRKGLELDRKEHKIEDVLTAYDQLIEISPGQPEYIIAAIQFLLENNQTSRACDYSERLIAYYEERKEWLPLSDALQQGLGFDPDRLAWRERLATIYSLLGQHDRAVNCHLEVARAHLELKQWSPARDSVDQSLRWEPRNCAALELSAQAFLGLNQPGRAADALKSLAARQIEEQNHAAAERALEQLEEIACRAKAGESHETDGATGGGALIDVLTLRAELFQATEEETRLVETLRRLTEELIQRESYARASESAHAVLDHHPDDIDAIRQLIAIFEATEKKENALEMKLRLGDAYHERQEHEAEIALYRELAEAAPDNWRVRKRLIEALVQTHRLEEAAPAAGRFLDQFGAGEQALEAIDLAHTVLEYQADNLELQKQLTELFWSAGLKDKWALQATQLINCYSRRNRHAEVAGLYEQLVRETPGNINFRINLIAAYVELKEMDKTREQYLQLAEHYQGQGHFEDAASSLNQALDILPEDEELLSKLGEVYAQSNQPEEQTSALKSLSDVYLKHDKTSQALIVLEEIVRLEPANTDVRERLLRLHSEIKAGESQVLERRELSRILAEQGRREEAVGHLREALAIKPDDIELRRQLASILLDDGQTTAGIAELWSMALLHSAVDQHDDVLRCLNEIQQHKPQDLQVRKMKAETYAKMGQEKKALEEFMRMSSETQTPASFTPHEATPPEERVVAVEGMPIVAEYTFEEFVVGDHNNFAYATCQAVAKAPAKHYNPVFIWSDVGLGKTHLVNAIANYVRAHEPQLKIHYTNSEEFTGQLIDAIRNNSLTVFRNYYKKIDLLLVDDIQFLAGKEKAQEEFFHVFNALFQAKKQLVVTSDRPPKEMAHLEKRLVSRFGAGVIIDIQAPDLETRMAILQKESEAHPDVAVDSAIIAQLAERIDSNVRALKAAFSQLIAMVKLNHHPLDEQAMQQLLTRVLDAI